MSGEGASRVPTVPRVDLLDASVEPTDAELEALMLDFRRVVVERRNAARAAFLDRLAAEIDEAMREDPATDSSAASSDPGHAP